MKSHMDTAAIPIPTKLTDMPMPALAPVDKPPLGVDDCEAEANGEVETDEELELLVEMVEVVTDATDVDLVDGLATTLVELKAKVVCWE
jgi:hypothetical protein